MLCAVVVLGEEYASYYVPEHEHHEPEIRQHYSDGGHHGHHGGSEYDHGGHRSLQNLHESHGHRNLGMGENHALRDLHKQAHYNQGGHSALQSAGGHHNHVQHAHDKGFYEREKKYGYEKAYGYERETNHHDKGNNAHSHGSNYHHNANQGHYNHGGQALRDLATHGNRYKHESDSHGNKGVYVDNSGDYNRGRDYSSSHNGGHHMGNIHMIPSHQRIRTYMPMFLHREYMPQVDGSLSRHKYLSGIHGLGGLRGYGMGYGYNPLRYGSNSLNMNGYSMHLRQPMSHYEEPTSNVYYVRHNV